MPRQARPDAHGTLPNVMVRAIEKRRIVDDETDAENLMARLGNAELLTGTALDAWSLMTNRAHLLLRSGQDGLPWFIRRFLTGYAIDYNHRHWRQGRLFQNRYKSGVCEEDSCFLELVRYIYLNPLRAGLVQGVDDLDRFPWFGHAVLMGKLQCEWMDRTYVLFWFGADEQAAVAAYGDFVWGGVSQGRRPELFGGGEFVEGVLAGATERARSQFARREGLEEAGRIIDWVCEEEGICSKEFFSAAADVRWPTQEESWRCVLCGNGGSAGPRRRACGV